MKKYISIILLCMSFVSFGQSPGDTKKVTITGTIIEASTGAVLEYATVAFTDMQGKIVTGGITDLEGKYAIKVPAGMYKVTFEFIGFETKTLENQNLNKDTTLPTVKLAEDSQALDEIVIRAETTEVQVRLDKKIYNIGKDLTTSGANVGDALANVPSVTVDIDGAIALRGNENVRILINGKPSAIAGFGSTDALRALPADAIDRVEVITSPSARYDAEGTAGILNIILRKEKTLGLNGSIQTNIGYPNSSGINGNINLRTEKFNIFNTTGWGYRESPGKAIFKNQYLSENIINPLVIETRDGDRIGRNFNTNLGIEYFLSDKTSLTASAFFSSGNDDDETVNLANEFNSSNELAISRNRTEYEFEDDKNYQFALNYITKFDDNGHELKADFQYENRNSDNTSQIDELNTFPNLDILPSEFITSDNTQKEYLAQIDYVRPIGENAQFEAGYRGNFSETSTDYELTEQLTSGGNFIRNDSLSNIFNYKENVNAVYTQYGNKFGKFSFLAGLRLEHTQLKGKVNAENVETIEDDALHIDFDKSYTGLFPTLNFTYELNDRENITLGYNRRINRPRGRWINPFPSRSSEANIFQGNTNLDPAFSSAFDLGYLKRWSKLTLTTSIYYQHETDAFERIQEDTGNETPNGIPIIRMLPINLSTNKRIGFEAGILYNPAPWLRLNGSFNFFQFNTEGEFNGVDYSAKNTSYFARGSAKVSLPYQIDWQTNAFYRGPSNDAQSENEGILSVDLALSKDIFNDNATLGLNVSDVFNSRKRKTLTTTNTFISESEFQRRPRSINLSFTYRFNQQKKARQQNNQNNDDNGEDF
ncbi:outer membrane receptor protein involved in Fe transport [Gelidibacter sediminis]|uniref:Outer membrane receptor protein involved in Fe transport n=1 Tax=Gelidibacter sediminis TaxID=1608710 RepID=A0A4R7Q6N2_9FLAO|nr:outer membrane beta-barrel family protein [Gelidibacter sediminis]TDU43245.1 outer membrane receptor protein involved in Fe transport [Gelidibacter sediminis]